MIFTEQHRQTLSAAIQTWGVSEQESMAIGECGEFLGLFGKRAQGRATEDDWISEISDVIIMMEQMSHMHGYDKVKSMVDYKMARLKVRLESHGVQFEDGDRQ